MARVARAAGRLGDPNWTPVVRLTYALRTMESDSAVAAGTGGRPSTGIDRERTNVRGGLAIAVVPIVQRCATNGASAVRNLRHEV